VLRAERVISSSPRPARGTREWRIGTSIETFDGAALAALADRTNAPAAALVAAILTMKPRRLKDWIFGDMTFLRWGFLVLSHGPVPHLQHDTVRGACHRRLE